MRKRKFETLAQARAYLKKHPNDAYAVRKLPNARKWKFFVGSFYEWLSL